MASSEREERIARLREVNRRRVAEAGPRQATRTAKALAATQQAIESGQLPAANWEAVARVRVEHPGESQAELGARLGMTKDAYARRLARFLKWAEHLNGSTAGGGN